MNSKSPNSAILTVTVLLLAYCFLTIPAAAETAPQLLHDHVRPAVTNGEAIPVAVMPATQRLKLAITLPLRHQDELGNLLKELYDPASPHYRQFLSVAQFSERFSPTPADYRKVVDFAVANGFTITAEPSNRLLVGIEGSVAQIEQAFHLSMMVYRHPTENRTFYSPDREPELNLSVPVEHIAGLNNFSIPRPMVARSLATHAVSGAAGSGPGGQYLGSDMRAAYYGGTALTGSGQSVGLFEYDGYNLSDVNSTFDGQSYSVAISNVLVDGASGASDGNDAEQVLDIVQAISMAPGLNSVMVYIAPGGDGSGDTQIFNQMATDNICKQIGVSWVWTPEYPLTDNQIFQEMAAQGQNIFAASGDWKAYPETTPAEYFPAENAFVTAVGGTDLTTSGAGGSWESETAWAYSGGGPSPDDVAIPSWQVGVANSSNDGSTTLRNVPDVAAESNFDNYLCVQGSCGGGWGGTSFATPRWAGFLALVNQQAEANGASSLGFINPALYSIGEGSNYGSDFHDITSGNNNNGNGVSYNAVAGYDLVTGWGSPNGQNLINALTTAPTPSFSIAPSPSSLTLVQGGSNESTTITVLDQGGFNGTVALSVSGLPSGVSATFSPSSTTGSSTLQLIASSTAATGTVTATITGTSGNLTETTSLSVTVNTAPSFTLTASPTSLSLVQGGSSATATIAVIDRGGFKGSVSFSASGLPSGVTASFNPGATSGTSTLSLTASSSAALGNATVTVTGTSGSLSASTTLSVAVNVPQSFTLAASPNSLTLVQGGASATTSIAVTDQGGFNGSVSFAASGLPSGVTASFNPSSSNSATTLTLSASSAASAGRATVTITGTSGSVSASTTLSLTVSVPPSFSLAASPSSLTLTQGGASASTTLAVTDQGGFNGSVALAASGLPSGVTASFSPSSTTGASTLTLTASSTAATGTATVTIKGTSGSLSASTTLSLTVNVPAGFSLSASPSSLTLVQGASATTAIAITDQGGFNGSVALSVSGLPSGVTASFNPSSTTGASTLTLAASSAAPTGTATLTIKGTSGSLSASTTLALSVNVQQGFTLAASPSSLTLLQGASATTAIAITDQGGFNGSVALSASGLPSGVTASFSPSSTTSASTLTLTASSSAATGTATVTIKGTSGSLSASTTLALTVNVPQGFSLAATPGSLTVVRGASATTAIAITDQGGFNGSVALSASGLPSGVTASFNPSSTTGASTLTLSASSTAATGTATITITGTSGSLSASATLSLTVNVPPGFTVGASPNSLTLAPGASGSSTIAITDQGGFNGSVALSVSGLPSGVTASFNPSSTTGSSVLTLSASSTATTGTASVTITGTSGSLSASTPLSLTVNVAQSFTLTASPRSLTLVQGGSSASTTIAILDAGGFNGNVSLAISGLPSGVTAAFNPSSSSSSSKLTLSASSTAATGAVNLTITGTSGNLSASTTLALTVNPPPSFTLSASPTSLHVLQGTSTTGSIVIASHHGFKSAVTLSVSGLPNGVAASFSSNPVTPVVNAHNTSVLTLSAGVGATPGVFPVTVKATSGSLTQNVTLMLRVKKQTADLRLPVEIANASIVR